MSVEQTQKPQRALVLGRIVQGIILGVLLTVALSEMATMIGDVRIFRYQGF